MRRRNHPALVMLVGFVALVTVTVAMTAIEFVMRFWPLLLVILVAVMLVRSRERVRNAVRPVRRPESIKPSNVKVIRIAPAADDDDYDDTPQPGKDRLTRDRFSGVHRLYGDDDE